MRSKSGKIIAYILMNLFRDRKEAIYEDQVYLIIAPDRDRSGQLVWRVLQSSGMKGDNNIMKKFTLEEKTRERLADLSRNLEGVLPRVDMSQIVGGSCPVGCGGGCADNCKITCSVACQSSCASTCSESCAYGFIINPVI